MRIPRSEAVWEHKAAESRRRVLSGGDFHSLLDLGKSHLSKQAGGSSASSRPRSRTSTAVALSLFFVAEPDSGDGAPRKISRNVLAEEDVFISTLRADEDHICACSSSLGAGGSPAGGLLSPKSCGAKDGFVCWVLFVSSDTWCIQLRAAARSPSRCPLCGAARTVFCGAPTKRRVPWVLVTSIVHPKAAEPPLLSAAFLWQMLDRSSWRSRANQNVHGLSSPLIKA